MENIYKSRRIIHQEHGDIPLLMEEDRFRYCLPLKFNCRNEKCQSEIIIKDIVNEEVREIHDERITFFLLYIYTTIYSSTYIFYIYLFIYLFTIYRNLL